MNFISEREKGSDMDEKQRNEMEIAEHSRTLLEIRM
jgi:hypothetical protein